MGDGEVPEWVAGLGLPAAVASLLAENGFDDLSFCEVMVAEDVELMGIPEEHRPALLAGAATLAEKAAEAPPTGRRMTVSERRSTISERRRSRASSLAARPSTGARPVPSPRRSSVSRSPKPTPPRPAAATSTTKAVGGVTASASTTDPQTKPPAKKKPPPRPAAPKLRDNMKAVNTNVKAFLKRLSSGQLLGESSTDDAVITPAQIQADFRACDVSMSDEERIKLMSLVRDGKMSVDDAVKEVQSRQGSLTDIPIPEDTAAEAAAQTKPKPKAQAAAVTVTTENADGEGESQETTGPGAPKPQARPRPRPRSDTSTKSDSSAKSDAAVFPDAFPTAAPAAQKLTHVNKLRPKGKGGRRPPSRAKLRKSRVDGALSGDSKSFAETAGLQVPKAAPRRPSRGAKDRPTSTPAPAAKARPVSSERPASSESKPKPTETKPSPSPSPSPRSRPKSREVSAAVPPPAEGPLAAFLAALGLSQYETVLTDNGYDELEFLPDATDEELGTIIDNAEHRKAILSGAAELKDGAPGETNPAAAPTAKPKPARPTPPAATSLAKRASQGSVGSTPSLLPRTSSRRNVMGKTAAKAGKPTTDATNSNPFAVATPTPTVAEVAESAEAAGEQLYQNALPSAKGSKEELYQNTLATTAKAKATAKPRAKSPPAITPSTSTDDLYQNDLPTRASRDDVYKNVLPATGASKPPAPDPAAPGAMSDAAETREPHPEKARLGGEPRTLIREYLREQDVKLWQPPYSDGETGRATIKRAFLDILAAEMELDVLDVATVVEYLRLSARKRLGMTLPPADAAEGRLTYVELDLEATPDRGTPERTSAVVYSKVVPKVA